LAASAAGDHTRAVFRIRAFPVPPDADVQFLEAWDDERPPGATLYRALRPDVELRFVDVAPLPAALRDDLDAFDVAREHGRFGADAAVTLIQAWELGTDGDERFLAAWERAVALLADRRGYVGTRLHRSVAADADFRFVQIGRWSSPLMVARAHRDPVVRTAVAAIPGRGDPALYEVVRD
jgi:hypothetical protein